MLRTFPGMNIVLPCDARQTKKLVELLVDYPEDVYKRQGECQDSDISFIFAMSCCELVATECLLK